MNTVLLHPAYFGPVSQYTVITQYEKIVLENFDSYQKQTYRNRMYIYDANGKLLLNIPIKHKSSLTGKASDGNQLYKDVLIDNSFEWQKQHWRALKASYQTSPFFEFYEDDIIYLYENQFSHLMDFNLKCQSFVFDAIGIEAEIKQTDEYFRNPTAMDNGRHLISAKKDFNFLSERYQQVFEPKHGFLNNLSILDLIFNLGPRSLDFLENQKLPDFNF
ncbi:WbqC-like protein family protein [Zunongwangia mangrovi]|uniref:WbqC-like protein family protein n=1 Tax=Zunongwangia mangrovi TaxID=1334022 RepID=A0A1I1J0L3_9FLAO|nr:WbqC family protein [Zunongwangia mangrovi]SFC40178.1 WbqC-like protein family protein [Zunongwangia mangrovi]